jgi:hypothetical protein
MRPALPLVLCHVALGLGLLLGCGSQHKGSSPSGEPKEEAAPRVQRVNVSSLPRLGDPFPADDGRIEVRLPMLSTDEGEQEWRREFSSKKGVVYLCRATDKAPYPRIYVQAADYPGVDHVTAGDVQEFAKAIRSQLRLEKPGDTREVTAVVIGEFAGAAYPGRGSDKGRDLDLLTIVTVSKGRKYSVELQADTGSREKYTPHLHAMARGINFSPPKDADSQPFGLEADKKPAKKDAETKGKP